MATIELRTSYYEDNGAVLKEISIVININGCELQFTPDCPQLIHDFEGIENDAGIYSTSEYDGEFGIVWTPEAIKFTSSMYGSGDKGGLYVSVPNTPEFMEQFRRVMRQWKAMY